MGLDGVELVMECEDEFGISIPDAEASAVRTPGQLTRLVERLLQQDGRTASFRACPSAQLFYEMRRGLVAGGFARDRIRPDATLNEIFETPDRVRQGARCPNPAVRIGTERTAADLLVFGLLASLTAGIAACLMYATYSHFGVTASATAFPPVLFVAVLTIASCWMRRSRLAQPKLSLRILIDEQLDSSRSVGFDDEEALIWLKVRNIVAEQLGIAVADVTPDADFVRDLGLE